MGKAIFFKTLRVQKSSPPHAGGGEKIFAKTYALPRAHPVLDQILNHGGVGKR